MTEAPSQRIQRDAEQGSVFLVDGERDPKGVTYNDRLGVVVAKGFVTIFSQPDSFGSPSVTVSVRSNSPSATPGKRFSREAHAWKSIASKTIPTKRQTFPLKGRKYVSMDPKVRNLAGIIRTFAH